MKNQKKKGRPKKFDNVSELQSKIDAYFGHRAEIGKTPTIESLAVWLDIDRRTLLNYEKEEGYDVFFPTIKKAKDKVLSEFIDDSLSPDNKTSAALTIFLMKNNFGYRDQQEVAVVEGFEVEF